MPLPPSPALSACDSLADIDDLDAFLEAQGALSHWPTPPPAKDDTTVTVHELDFESDVDELEDYHIARVFTEAASIEVAATPSDIDAVQGILVRSQLPPEVLALAYNILEGLNCQELPRGSFYSAPCDLIVVSALSLAFSYTSDHPHSFSHWSRHICDRTWTALRIDKTTLQILEALDWRLHSYSTPTAIQSGLNTLSQTTTETWRYSLPDGRDYEPIVALRKAPSETPPRLKVVIDGTSSCWDNGQVTPDGTPPPSIVEGSERFLPVL